MEKVCTVTQFRLGEGGGGDTIGGGGGVGEPRTGIIYIYIYIIYIYIYKDPQVVKTARLDIVFAFSTGHRSGFAMVRGSLVVLASYFKEVKISCFVAQSHVCAALEGQWSKSIATGGQERDIAFHQVQGPVSGWCGSHQRQRPLQECHLAESRGHQSQEPW